MTIFPSVETLGSVPAAVLALVLFGSGVMLLLLGWNIYRVVLVTLGVLVGAAMGAGVAFLMGLPMILLALPLGLLVGVVSVRLEKVGAFLVGGLCSAVPLLIGREMFAPGYGIYVAAGLAFLITGTLAVLLWRPMIIVSFAVIGASLMAEGVLIATDSLKPNSLRDLAGQHPYWTAGVMAFVTLVGVCFQATGDDDGAAKVKK